MTDGERPVFGSNRRLQDDPHFRDHVLFHEYFHGDTRTGRRRIAPDGLDRPRREAAAADGGKRRRRLARSNWQQRSVC